MSKSYDIRPTPGCSLLIRSSNIGVYSKAYLTYRL